MTNISITLSYSSVLTSWISRQLLEEELPEWFCKLRTVPNEKYCCKYDRLGIIWQLWCHCNPDHDKFSSLSNTFVHRRMRNFLFGGGSKPFAQKILSSCPNFFFVQSKRNEGHTMQPHRLYLHMKVARYCNSFSGSIPPSSEHNYVATDKHLEKLPPQFY